MSELNNFAIYENNKVVNVVVAESLEDVELVAGTSAVKVTDGEPWVDWVLIDGNWVPPKPFDSWHYDNGSWVAPYPMPEDSKNYYWNEESGSWEIFLMPQPFPSWTLDENYSWAPPIDKPDDGVWRWDEDSLSWVQDV